MLVLEKHIPWQIKVAAKILFARIPLRYRTWKKLGLFKHGRMEQPEYAFRVFDKHFERVRFSLEREGGFVGLELGPGDSLFSALIAKAFGASLVYLVDTGPFACRDLVFYRRMESYLSTRGFRLSEFAKCTLLEELLAACSAQYLTNGLASLSAIASESVDFVWSHAVLQHIRRDEFLPTLQELRRLQRPGGVGSHRVDLRDHLGGALNHLRFEDPIWESRFMASSGFYTNRIRYGEMLQLFHRAGFEVDVLKVDRWAELPTARNKLATPFRDLAKEELSISGFEVLLH